VFRSLASDGGLFIPESIEPFAPAEVDALLRAPFVEGSAKILRRLGLSSLTAEVVEDLVAASLDFPLPLRLLEGGSSTAGGDSLAVLELFWGPTLAFKDVGARFMARLMAHLRPEAPRDDGGGTEGLLTILAATSGDTGSAVAHAFFQLPGFRVVVLFPRGQVSAAQQRLFTTLGGNVTSVEVDGTFDDCQRLVKRAFADHDLRQQSPLASANSINVARLLPQTLYYYEMCRQLQAAGEQRPLWVSTPSGNFGNLTAGLYARRLGLPMAQLIAATNRNDVVPEYLAGADYRARPSVRTPSNAMDVGDPSNFRRIEALYGGSDAALRRDLIGARFSDRETLDGMRELHDLYGLTLDPHAAVGYLGLKQALATRPDEARLGVFLATAHPAKFSDVVHRALGEWPELPAELARCMDLPEQVVRLSASSPEASSDRALDDQNYQQLRQILLEACATS
jgi:threonine synthase